MTAGRTWRDGSAGFAGGAGGEREESGQASLSDSGGEDDNCVASVAEAAAGAPELRGVVFFLLSGVLWSCRVFSSLGFGLEVTYRVTSDGHDAACWGKKKRKNPAHSL